MYKSEANEKSHHDVDGIIHDFLRLFLCVNDTFYASVRVDIYGSVLLKYDNPSRYGQP
jgi:hypothetical protein